MTSCEMDTFPAPEALARSTVAMSGSKPSGQAHTISSFKRAARRIHEWVMLLPSPTYTTCGGPFGTASLFHGQGGMAPGHSKAVLHAAYSWYNHAWWHRLAYGCISAPAPGMGSVLWALTPVIRTSSG